MMFKMIDRLVVIGKASSKDIQKCYLQFRQKDKMCKGCKYKDGVCSRMKRKCEEIQNGDRA